MYDVPKNKELVIVSMRGMAARSAPVDDPAH